MSSLIDIRPSDQAFYDERLRTFLPDSLIDIHTHVWRQADRSAKTEQQCVRTVSWPSRVAEENPIEDLLETYRLMLPGKRVTPLVFPTVPAGDDIDRLNAYTAHAARSHQVPALLFTHPSWTAEETESRLLAGGYCGAKSYLSLAPAYLPGNEIRILDFFPPHQLDVLNRRRMIVMLHIPRPARLRDPVNLAQMLEIEDRFPELQLIIAHVGRAYCDHDVGNAFSVLAPAKRMLFDFSANTNDHVFEQLIEAVGPKRILFGTDLPILRMRMRRITRGDHYVNIVPRGLYGDVSDDPNMDEVDGAEAERLTFFLYEEIDAFRRAAQRTGLTVPDVNDVFAGNAERLLANVKA